MSIFKVYFSVWTNLLSHYIWIKLISTQIIDFCFPAWVVNDSQLRVESTIPEKIIPLRWELWLSLWVNHQHSLPLVLNYREQVRGFVVFGKQYFSGKRFQKQVLFLAGFLDEKKIRRRTTLCNFDCRERQLVHCLQRYRYLSLLWLGARRFTKKVKFRNLHFQRTHSETKASDFDSHQTQIRRKHLSTEFKYYFCWENRRNDWRLKEVHLEFAHSSLKSNKNIIILYSQ